ncbi:MAG: bifunctional UDP-N-acetylmuramoyl-tripeptide:D-alanyl-D-alanine ligase/alanine racemase [Prevotellaceae bacterium]|jgi:alanine racemase|nr:bifunctional UDP-N-acetylmuramoyl-tripeptide:D-alanyl-D-alanine ligase/alanine racemase [Prevotellaceae bacterium]
MPYTLSAVAEIMNGALTGKGAAVVTDIATDSRSTFYPDKALFFAIAGERHNGHLYLGDLYERGVRAFVVSEEVNASRYPQASFIAVPDTLRALQALAAHHRRRHTYPVVAVAGSNGKTIVKEWIAQLLSTQLRLARSPKSYNSQVGVPLSAWRMGEESELGIFEAGISQPGEMERLEDILRPDVVVFTNLGEAHQEGFATREQKLREKLRLCANAEAVAYCADQYEVHTAICATAPLAQKRRYCWGASSAADVRVISTEKSDTATNVTVEVTASQKRFLLNIPFTDAASTENALHSFTACMLLAQLFPSLHINEENVAGNVAHLSPIAMRLDLHEGVNGCTIINDAYNADVASLRIALDFLSSFSKHRRRTVILSDIEQSGKEGWRLYGEVAELLREHGVSRLIAIGAQVGKHLSKFTCEVAHFSSTGHFLRQFDRNTFRDEAILIKGSRSFLLEQISRQLEQKTHLTTLEVNLTALTDNLNALRAKLKKGVKTLAMVKANAYGMGLSEVARLLQHQRVSYLGVAFADEGVQLRRAGITMPILVLNPEPGTFEQMLDYRLEPEIYSLQMLQRYSEAALRSGEGLCSIHVKLDTGMYRLGFAENELEELLSCLSRFRNLKVASIFSHLAAADEPQHDDFTRAQIALFDAMSKRVESELGYKTLRHLANSAGVERFPEAQLDMVRLGISLYGVSATKPGSMRTVSALKSTVVQVKRVPAGDTVGYGRKGRADEDKTIAVIPVGYADGLNRLLGNGAGSVLVNGKQAPFIGNICMDLCMVDVTGIEVREGDEVTVFGENPGVASLAEKLNTIPYEIFTRISARVNRTYFSE